jgi:cell division inhibitor SepF
MASAMRKMAEYLGLVDGGEYAEGYDVVDGYADYRESDYRETNVQEQYTQAPLRPVAQAPTYEPTGVPAARPTGDLYRITTLHPHTYNDARRIGEEFRNGTPVIMNLGDMDDEDARRIVDFSAGLAFGLHGSIEKVAKGVFLLSPANVDIGAAARAQLREDPFFNQS